MEYKFDVFISYRHADLDSAVAGYLQKALERYRIPGEIRKKCGKEKINRVFRDEEELGVASDLFGEIEENLKQSEFLLVVCSPRIVESKWCLREIETFIKYRGRENILAVLIEGEPETSFPPALLEEGEPLAADLRGRDKREVLRHARERMTRLAAPLLYCSYDELYQRHRVYKMRRMLALAGVVTAVTLVFGAVALYQNLEIKANYEAKLENQSRYLAKVSGDLLEQGDRETALLVALAGLPGSDTDRSRPYVSEARVALEEALYTYRWDYWFNLHPQKILEHKSAPGTVSDYSGEEGVLLTFDSDGRIYLWDGETCDNIFCFDGVGRGCEDARLVGNRRVAVKTAEGIFCFRYDTGETVWEWNFPECTSCSSSYGFLWDYNRETGEIVCAYKVLRYDTDYVGSELKTMLTDGHRIHIIEADTGESAIWTPDAVYQELAPEEDGRISWEERYILKLGLSPEGGRLALVTGENNIWHDSGNVVKALQLGGEEAVFELEAKDQIPDYLGWLDEDTLAVVWRDEEAPLFGSGLSESWTLECWDISTGELRFRHEDTSMVLNRNISVSKVPGTERNPALVSVIYDNVAVNLDWNTGERYARMEDRSPIVLSRINDTGLQMAVTGDGYVFSTNATEDRVYDAILSAYHYYLDLDEIRKAEWHDQRAFFYTDTAVYCYGSEVDESYTILEETPYGSWFTRDSSLLYLLGSDHVYLYDTEDYSLLWQDGVRYDFLGKTAVLAEDRYALYLDGEEAIVHIHDIRSGEDRQVLLEGMPEDARDLRIRSTGGPYAVAWCMEYYYASDWSRKNEELQNTAAWVINSASGEIVRQLTYGEIFGRFPAAELEEKENQWAYLDLREPALTGDGRYFILPCQLLRFSTDKDTEPVYLFVWDMETGQARELQEEITAGLAGDLEYGSYYGWDGWLAPEGSLAVLYDRAAGLLKVVDFSRGTVLHELEAEGIGSCGVAFTPDGEHLIFQDSRLRLRVYRWTTGEYTMSNVSPENGSLDFYFWQEGRVLGAVKTVSSGVTKSFLLYDREEAGVYRANTGLSRCEGSDGKTAVIKDGSVSRLYHVYTLEELIAWARELLGDRELTPEEKREYFIE
ncbi:MAG: toll/interleukin-1 receptor domain-containing protein [Roseburia sp.]|nr:toll/interleukin-1 receptor domain-containing protein [Roseburia sp.]MCM1097313.1 toll/interleukin-1 receptor domain-containing protein [Ruminococcus flavefaciens]